MSTNPGAEAQEQVAVLTLEPRLRGHGSPSPPAARQPPGPAERAASAGVGSAQVLFPPARDRPLRDGLGRAGAGKEPRAPGRLAPEAPPGNVRPTPAAPAAPARRPPPAMSRIYQDGALRPRPVHSARLPGAWDPAAHQGGPGVLLEGELVDVSRHSIVDAHGRKERYRVLHVRPSRVHRRKFDPQGCEVEPSFSAARKVNTGFLPSSYRLEAKGGDDRLTAEALRGLVEKPELLALTAPLTPARALAFWVPEADVEAVELEPGAGLRLRTRGDGPFVESFARLEAGTVTRCNFAGDAKAGASWTDSVLAHKSSEEAPAAGPREQGDGAEDAEWDD